MKILLARGDGIHAPGLRLTREKLAARHTVTVVAPDRERSGVGHGITLHEPLRITPVAMNGGGRWFAVNGSPADCVGLGFAEILDEKPDLVVSGINIGVNVGMDTHYSGTVAAAMEAASLGAPAIAAS
ncbi:MAG: 5'/3'-nucleotidase SurE, partial [Desulfobacterales bacterium]|nr:5'/3'-nucleotidase SurE [Desulfobacterales bacterium]